MTVIEPQSGDAWTSILDVASISQGHFLFESGHHGDRWLDLEALFTDARRLQGWASTLARQAESCGPEVVCGPLFGGAFVAQAIAADLGVRFVYAERDKSVAGTVEYHVPGALRGIVRGRCVLLVDDAVNAGSALRLTLSDLLDCGAELAGLASLLTSGDAASRIARQHGVPLFALASFDRKLWLPEACPMCDAGLPLSEPPCARDGP